MCVLPPKWRHISITLCNFIWDNFNGNNVRFKCSQGTQKMVFACQKFGITCILSNFWRIWMCQKQKLRVWTMCLLEAKTFDILQQVPSIARLGYIFQVASNTFEKQFDLPILWPFEKHRILKESNHPPNRGYVQNACNFLTNQTFLVLVLGLDLPLCG